MSDAQLAAADNRERQRERQRRHRRRGLFEPYESEQDTARDKKGLAGGVPSGMRQAALHLIDYQLTPMLVDQWRCAKGSPRAAHGFFVSCLHLKECWKQRGMSCIKHALSCAAPDELPAESKLQSQCKSKPSFLCVLIMLGTALQ